MRRILTEEGFANMDLPKEEYMQTTVCAIYSERGEWWWVWVGLWGVRAHRIANWLGTLPSQTPLCCLPALFTLQFIQVFQSYVWAITLLKTLDRQDPINRKQLQKCTNAPASYFVVLISQLPPTNPPQLDIFQNRESDSSLWLREAPLSKKCSFF